MKKTTFFAITTGVLWALVATIVGYTLTDWQYYMIIIPGIFVFSVIYHHRKNNNDSVGYIKLTNQHGKPFYVNVRAIMNYRETEPCDDVFGKHNTVLTYLDDRKVNVQETVEEINLLIKSVTKL
jgi:uncharacterized protein YlzI (FlbEa/FlbD family)